MEKYKPIGNESRLGAVKKLNGSSLLPCRAVLLQKLRRTCLIANIWMSSSTSRPLLNPTEYGWKYNGRGMYDLNWFEGEACPKSLDAVYEEANNSDSDGEEYSEGEEYSDGEEYSEGTFSYF